MSEHHITEPKQVAELAEKIAEAVETVIQGASVTVHMLTAALFCGGHVLLEDMPGTGKTTLVKAFAKATGCDTKRIQCTPDLMPADLTGFEVLEQLPTGERAMRFRKGAVFTNLLLADEINRMAPRSQSGLLECMAERQVTCSGKEYALPVPFFVIATQNPIELQGTFPLPEAQLDRFLMRLQMGTPVREQELEVLRRRRTAEPLEAIPVVTTPEMLIEAETVVREVTISDSVLSYMLDFATATRNHVRLRYGLSTRGLLALQKASQAYAAMDGRSYVLPDDVKAMIPAICTHRISANGGLLTDRQSASQIIAELLESVSVEKA